jgi:hypothetical protein
MEDELSQISQQMNNMSIKQKQYKFNNLTIEEKINTIIRSQDFSHNFLVNCYENSDWELIKYDIAYKIGKLGDINFYNNFISVDYNKTLDNTIQMMTLKGASEMGHVHIIYMISEYIDVEQLDVVINVFNSGNVEASYNLINNFDDINMIMYALGATGKLDILKTIIHQSETDILIPLESAAEYGKLNIIKYYYEELMIDNTVDIYHIMCLILNNYHFKCFTYLLEELNLDLTIIYNRLLPGFDFNKYIPLIDEYFYRFGHEIQ